ncbi:hypothetical protein [Streptomyces sp. NPDC002758]
MPQHEKFRVFRGIAAKQHRRQGEQLSGHPIQQGHDHRDMLRRTVTAATSDDDFSSGTAGVTSGDQVAVPAQHRVRPDQ